MVCIHQKAESAGSKGCRGSRHRGADIAGPASVGDLPAATVLFGCGKMLVRAGVRCACHYELSSQCPNVWRGSRGPISKRWASGVIRLRSVYPRSPSGLTAADPPLGFYVRWLLRERLPFDVSGSDNALRQLGLEHVQS